ncbi:MAG: transketolase, partial [Deltaproteobacteria bacterium]|nr:transketolase [Deltaproteobacteria bacterium]
KGALSSGAYILSDSKGLPDVILIASGSEVHLAVEAKKILQEKEIKARVVSMPSWELFEKTSDSYKNNVILPGVTARVAIEAGISMGWERYAGDKGIIIGIDTFGASAPGGKVLKKYGFTVENIVKKVTELLE